MTLVDHGRLLSAPERVSPTIRDWPRLDRRPDGTVVLGMNGVVVETADAIVVVDPGGPVEASVADGSFEAGVGLDAALDSLGVSPERVTHVVVTHGHVDHYLGVVDAQTRIAPLSDAEHLFPAADLTGGPDHDRYVEPVAAAGKLRSTYGDETVCAGVRVLAAAGRDPGTSGRLRRRDRGLVRTSSAISSTTSTRSTTSIGSRTRTSATARPSPSLASGSSLVRARIPRPSFRARPLPGGGRIMHRDGVGWVPDDDGSA